MNDHGRDDRNLPPGEQDSEGSQARPPLLSPPAVLMLIIVAIFVTIMISVSRDEQRSEINWGFFLEQLDADNIELARFQGTRLTGEFKVAPAKDGTIPEPPKDEESGDKDDATADDPKGTAQSAADADQDKPLLKKFVCTAPPKVDDKVDSELRTKLGAKLEYVNEPDHTIWFFLFYIVLMLLLFGAVWMMIRRTREQMMGGGVLPGFSKSPARRYSSGENRVTFDDVAGVDSVKLELEELVDYLKDPSKFQRMGARVPKGVLLMGPPGSGKTLLARAVAGEAGVPFFSVNGSEFIQMFVGVGASRVRDLFTTAKMQAPAILFIDEIDAVGRLRGTGVGGGHDEREQTLNQILSEMDGFTPTQSVIVLAATNRPDVLDPALLRPGRFDRHITVDRPTYKGRVEIFKVHTREIPMADDVDLERIASATVGLTGADIANLVNEATLWATRQDKNSVEMADFEYAKDKVFMGAKREEMLTDEEKRITAYHESGHALISWLEPENDRVHKVTIIPRGRALGLTQIVPDEDQVHIAEKKLRATLAAILGGRAAEKLVFGERSAGAENDLQKATQMARSMVTRWGMSDRVGPVTLRTGEHHPFLGKEMAEARQFSEHTAQMIDEEIVRILREAEEHAMSLLSEHRDKLDTLAQSLEDREELIESDIAELIGPADKKPRKAQRIGGVDRPQHSADEVKDMVDTIRKGRAIDQGDGNHKDAKDDAPSKQDGPVERNPYDT